MKSTLSRFLLLVLLGGSRLAGAEIVADSARGVYAIWARPEITDRLPFLRGEQVRLQWRDDEPEAWHYNAIGTEFLIIRPEERDPGKWTDPPGVTLAPEWTEEIATDAKEGHG